MRLLTAVSGVRVPQQAPESTQKRVLFFYISGHAPLRVQRHARGQARRHAESQWTRLRRRANNRYSVALLLTGVRVPWQAPESTRKRVLLFCFGLSPLRIQYNQYARVQTRRHAEPQWTRLRRRRTIAIPSRCSLRGFEQSCRRQRQNNEPKGKRLRHFTFKVISGACACAGGDGAGEGGGGTGHAPY